MDSPLPAAIGTISFGKGTASPAARAAGTGCSVAARAVCSVAAGCVSEGGSLACGPAGLEVVAPPAEAAVFVPCAGWLPPNRASIPARTSGPVVVVAVPSVALAPISPASEPRAETRHASSPGNGEAPVVEEPSASGVASAGCREGDPGSDNGKGRAGNDAGTGRAATQRELQMEGQTGAAAFSRICVRAVRQKTVRRAIAAKFLARSTPLRYPTLRPDSLSFERVVRMGRSWHSPCPSLRAWTP